MIYVRGGVIVLAGFLCVFGASAQVPESIDPQRKTFGKSISWGVSVREAYDDNYLGHSGGDGFPIEASWVTTFSPTAAYSFNIPDTDMTARYSYSANIYSARKAVAGGKVDQSHDFRLDLAHMFSQRLRLQVQEIFTPGFQPQIDEGVRQFNGNYIQNRVEAGLDYDLSSRFQVGGRLTHYFIQYDNPSGTNVLSVAETMDRQTYGGTGSIKYRYNSETSGSLYYGHMLTSYDFQPGRNNEADMFGFAFDHNFGPRLTTRLTLGIDAINYDGKNGTDINPDINFITTYLFSPRTSAAFTFYSRAQPTEIQQYLSQTVYSMSLAFMHQFTSRLMGTVSLSYIPAEYDAQLITQSRYLIRHDAYGEVATRSMTETTTAVGVNFNYQFNPHITLSSGVSFTDVKSQAWNDTTPDNRSYQRTLTYVQLSVGF